MMKYWINALRPKTLPASAAPVLLGGAMAYLHGGFAPMLFILTLVCALLMQVITNFINEIYDYKKGADTEERLGPPRFVSTGHISVKAMSIVSAILIAVTFLLGMILVYYSSTWILLAGVVSLFFAWAYTGGPYPLAYHGLGDTAALIFFGIIAVCGTYYIQTLEVSWAVFVQSLAPGFISMNILGVNNLRDIEQDPKAGKITLAVRLGKTGAVSFYRLLNFTIYAVSIVSAVLFSSFWVLLPLISLPIALKLNKDIELKTGKELNLVLAGTGKLQFVYGILGSLGFVLSRVI